ncbi:MAG TPA: hypothetical protein VFT49_00075 [Candidatus Saccharimonadales bacterium]|nr:hypothetical protein [Candidatus Saccharimonadales bacterium]
MNEHERESAPEYPLIPGNPTERPIKQGQIWRHKDGGAYSIDEVDEEPHDTTLYEAFGILGRTVHYTQLDQGSFPPGYKWEKNDHAFVGKVMINGQEVEIFTLEQDVDDSAGN